MDMRPAHNMRPYRLASIADAKCPNSNQREARHG
jgi:hypothetical protein